jgi:hypothetical protein
MLFFPFFQVKILLLALIKLLNSSEYHGSSYTLDFKIPKKSNLILIDMHNLLVNSNKIIPLDFT